MDITESSVIVYGRIQELDPTVNAVKIIGYLLLHDNVESDMIRLAFGPVNWIISLINQVKPYIALSTSESSFTLPPEAFSNLHVSFSSPRPFLSPPNLSYWHPQKLQSFNNGFSDHVRDDTHIESLYTENVLGSDIARTDRRPMPVKICHYFSKGFCKNGSSCKFFHGQGHSYSSSSLILNEIMNTEQYHVFPPSSSSLRKLEMELTELLKCRRGLPISIASLPMMYYEKYGKTLQAEGYLTESQRHGKAGYSLTKLLSRLKNSILLIDRPHGQHAVILAEDFPRLVENGDERRDSGAIVAGSHQIYLTFPAESNFSEEDVCNYFKNFGPVEDVRIPSQLKRMFGFVTFVHAETVQQIFAKGNPHFVRGARVLVKPYREKFSPMDQKVTNPVYYSQQFREDGMCSFAHYGVLQKQLEEENEKARSFDKSRLAELQLAPSAPFWHKPYFGYTSDNLEVYEETEETKADLARRFSYSLDVLNSEDSDRPASTDCNDSRSSYQGFNLPENPFAFSTGRDEAKNTIQVEHIPVR